MNNAGRRVHFVTNESGTRLALTLLSNGPSPAAVKRHRCFGPVLLAHGTFSNHRSVLGLAQHLFAAGFDCWMLDFQGHGYSEKPNIEPNFESMCLEDSAAALDYLKAHYPDQKIIWIGHSGGGLAVLALLCRQPEYQSSLKAIVTMASQATHAARTGRNRFIIQISRFITRVLGVAPGKYFKLGPENEFSLVMRQWYCWSLSGQWIGNDGFNYITALRKVTTPALMLSGSDDNFIAPPEGCEALFIQLGSNDKHYQNCGLSTGFLENYTHSRLVISRSASQEIWPLIHAWLVRT